jgi:hypothetical protein
MEHWRLNALCRILSVARVHQGDQRPVSVPEKKNGLFAVDQGDFMEE